MRLSYLQIGKKWYYIKAETINILAKQSKGCDAKPRVLTDIYISE